MRVARFTNALRNAKSLSRRLRAAARKIERPKARLLGIVAGDCQLYQIVGDASHVKRFEVDASVSESVGHIGEDACLVLECHQMHFALTEANVGRLERAAGDDDIVGEDAGYRDAAGRNRRQGFDVDPASAECLRHSREVSRMIGELD